MFQDEKCRLMHNLSLSTGCPKNSWELSDELVHPV